MSRFAILVALMLVSTGCLVVRDRVHDPELAPCDTTARRPSAGPAHIFRSPSLMDMQMREMEMKHELEMRKLDLTQTGTLVLTANVAGADILVDDVLFGQVQEAGEPQEFVLVPGKSNLTVKKAGYHSYQAAIGVAPGGVNRLAIALVPAEASPAASIQHDAAPDAPPADAPASSAEPASAP